MRNFWKKLQAIFLAVAMSLLGLSGLHPLPASAAEMSVWALEELVVSPNTDSLSQDITYTISIENPLDSMGMQGAIVFSDAAMELLQWPYGAETTQQADYGLSNGIYAGAQYLDNVANVCSGRTSVLYFSILCSQAAEPQENTTVLELPLRIPDADTIADIGAYFHLTYDMDLGAYLFPICWMSADSQEIDDAVVDTYAYLDATGMDVFETNVTCRDGYIAVRVPRSESEVTTGTSSETTTAITASETTMKTDETATTTETVTTMETTVETSTETTSIEATITEETTTKMTTTEETHTEIGATTESTPTETVSVTDAETTTTAKDWYVILQQPSDDLLQVGNSFYVMYSTNSKSLIWESTDEEIASVNADGRVTIHQTGVVSILALCYESPQVLDSVLLQIWDGTETTETTTEATTTVTETTTTTTTVPETTEPFLMGDGDLDGEIDTFDAYYALRFYAAISAGHMDFSLDADPIRAARMEYQLDVSSDGTIDTMDAFYILRYYAFQSSGRTDITWEEVILREVHIG